jgi:hypothetical protein
VGSEHSPWENLAVPRHAAVKTVTVNRAPVLTLWGAVVAERLGHDPAAALSLGKAVAVLNARSKGQRLGIFSPPEPTAAMDPQKARKRRGDYPVEICGRPVPVRDTPAGVRAVVGGKEVTPESARRYLEHGFGDQLKDVRAALEQLAAAYSPEELERAAYHLYERFRPVVPAGTRGWGAAGTLDLTLIRDLARHRRE